MVDLIAPGDVTGLPGLGATGYTDDQITKIITRAETRLRREIKLRGCDLTQLITDPEMLELVKGILGDAVARTLRGADGYESESEGDYSYKLRAIEASANVWFPDKDLALICPGQAQATVGTIRLGLPRHRAFP